MDSLEQHLSDRKRARRPWHNPLPQVVKEGYSTRFLQASELAAAYRYKTHAPREGPQCGHLGMRYTIEPR